MSKMSKQSQISTSFKVPHDHAAYKCKMFWHLRWFVALVFATGYLACITTSILGFVLTHNLSFLALAPASTALSPALISLVPMDKRRYLLKLRKTEVKAETTRRRQKLR
jgi:hypothetical protein